MKACAVSIDLDPIGHYYAIHGLKDPPPDLACTAGLERFLELSRKVPFKATLFIVASELERNGFAELVREAARAGHEIANHTLSHRYDLSTMEPSEVKREILEAHERIADITGTPPRGFRAPGYNLSGEIMKTLAELNYLYDSSVFPSWPYYTAKVLIMGFGRIAGKKSRAITGPLSSMISPTGPYNPSTEHPYSRGASLIRELPISLSPVLRFPLIGTSFVLAGPVVSRFLYSAIGTTRLFNLEFHGIDFLGKDEVGLSLQGAGQPDANLELDVKSSRIESLFLRLKSRRFVTLAEAAQIY